MYSHEDLFQCLQEGYFGVYFPSCKATREINSKITLEWVQKQLVMRVYTLLYFLHDIMNPKMTIKTMIFTHHPGVSLARFSFWWWRHNRLLMRSQWPDNCDAIMWIVMSNLLDIDFIHSNIHGRSCKKIEIFRLVYSKTAKWAMNISHHVIGLDWVKINDWMMLNAQRRNDTLMSNTMESYLVVNDQVSSCSHLFISDPE